jgi:hypothetical protein
MFQAPIAGDHVTFIGTEMAFEANVVKGAPYSADAITETIQLLHDGNRIVRKQTTTLYRDSQGRTRREQSLGAIGPFAKAGEPQKTIFITDPVAGATYILDPESRTARKMAAPGNRLVPGLEAGVMVGRRFGRVEAQGSAGMGHTMTFERRVAAPAQPPKTEPLGKRMIEGVEAEGTRTTMTIPAGEIGNERPIEIVSERWHSAQLQTVVLTKRNDPMMGETTYRLTNINLTEPPPLLFQVPADYTVKEAPAPMLRMQSMPHEK